MDLTASRAFICSRSSVLKLNENDVVPVEKAGVDTQWHGFDAYIGVALSCKRCVCEFSFSAEEQKAWREVYGFSIHSFPIHCRPCRAIERNLASIRKRLSSALGKGIFAQSDFDEIIDAVGLLLDSGQMDSIGPRLKQKIFWAGKRSLHPRRIEIIQALKNEK